MPDNGSFVLRLVLAKERVNFDDKSGVEVFESFFFGGITLETCHVAISYSDGS